MRTPHRGKGSYFGDRDRIDRNELRRRFTDREGVIETFELKLKQSPPVPVLVFFGLGGCGKTYLLHYLLQEYGYRWQDSPAGYPHAYVNFRPGYTPTATSDALWEIRSQLRRGWPDFAFPRFDLLWTRLWERMHKVSIQSNATLLPEEVGWVSELLQGTEQVPVIGDVAKGLNLLARLGDRVRRWLAQRRVLDWFITNIEEPYRAGWKAVLQTIEIGELEMLLPKAAASDIADGSEKSPSSRAIVFVDAFEYLQERLGDLRGKEMPTFVEIFSEELLRLKAHVLLVIGGKDKVRWAEVRRHDGTWILDAASQWAQGVTRNDVTAFVSARLEQYQVGDLSEQASKEYLEVRRGLTDERLIQGVYQLTGGYPLGLGTAVDLMEEAAEAAASEVAILRSRVANFAPLSKEWREELCGWLLERLVEQLAVHRRHALLGFLRAAAIPRWFNEELLFHIVQAHDVQEQFDQLIGYSFVERHQLAAGILGRGAYRLHPTVRTLLRREIRIDTQRLQWNRAALAYFEELAVFHAGSDEGFACEVETLYHRLVLSTIEGMKAFEKVFERELGSYRINRCEILLQAVSDVGEWETGEKARILALAGRLDMVSVRYQSALEKLEAAEKLEPLSRGVRPTAVAIMQYRAESCRLSGDYEKALRCWDEMSRAVGEKEEPHVRFIVKWGKSLTYKMVDEIVQALELCEEADAILKSIVDSPELSAGAGAFGIHGLSKKPADISRHKAELLRYMGDYATATICCDSFLGVYERQADSLSLYYGLLVLAHLRRMEGGFDEALAAAERARDGFETVAEPRGQFAAKRALGQISFARGDDRRARAYFEELVAIPLGSYPHGPVYAHLGLGELARLSGDVTTARDHYASAAVVCQGLGSRVEIGYAKLGLAEIARHAGDDEVAISLAKEANDIAIRCGQPWMLVYANLVAASAAGKQDQVRFVQEAVRAGQRFRRRPLDVDLEAQTIRRIADILSEGRQVLPFRLNFL